MTSSTSGIVSSSSLPLPSTKTAFYQRAQINPLNPTPATAIDIGYLAKNKTQLEVVGELTSQASTDIYKFTYQDSGSVALTLKNLNGTTSVHVQLLDASGSRVLADSQGNNATLTDAYAQLKAGNLNLKAGQYLIKVTYGTGGDKTHKQDYTLQLGSGTTFTSDYRTLASPATIQQSLLTGGSLGYSSGAASASAIVSNFNAYLNGGTPDYTPIDPFTGITA